MNLAKRLQIARDEADRLERLVASAPCSQLGHDWEGIGGCNCGCEGGQCSVPVKFCKRCRDCDYGDNDEATEIRRRCSADRSVHE